MDQKDLFEEGEEKSGEPSAEEPTLGFEDFGGGEGGPEPQEKKSKIKLFLGIGVLVIAGAYAASLFLFKEEEPVAPPSPIRMPIKAAPAMGVATGIKAKEVAKAEAAKGGEKPEAKKEEVKVAKKEEPAPKPEKPAPKVEKVETKKQAEMRVSAKEEAAKPEIEAKGEGFTVVVGPYPARYELESAQEKLKGSGVRMSPKEVKKRLMMNRVLIKEVRDKGEVDRLLSELRGKGYDPFSVRANGGYKVYAVSNSNEDTSNMNKADLEKLGYSPVIEKKEITVKVFELTARVKSEKEAGTLSSKLEKMGFRAEVR